MTIVTQSSDTVNLEERIKAGIEAVDRIEAEAKISDFLLNEGADDEGNAQCVNRVHAGRFCHTNSHGWMANDGRYWTHENAEEMLDRAIVGTLKARRMLAAGAGKEAIVKATKPTAANVRNAKSLFRSIVPAKASDFDNDPDSLNCANGVVDLRTGMLRPRTHDDRFTYCLGVDYDQGADCSAWVEFLQSATGDPEIADYLQMAMGYSVTGHTDEEVAWYVEGPPRSGKGTFTETLLRLLGRPLAVQTDFGTFTAARDADAQNFALAPLKPARLVIAGETNRHERLNEAKIKTLTGGDYIRCAFKHRDHFEYRPQFKVWMVSNHQIIGDVDDDAFWGRVRVIQFPNSHLGKEDKTLKRRMKSKKNLRGVLAWLVAGAVRWYASPTGLVTPQSTLAVTKKHRDDLDYLQQWLDECCTAGEWTSAQLLYQSYQNWCNERGVTPQKNRTWGMGLKKKGHASETKWTGEFGVKRVYPGLALIDGT